MHSSVFALSLAAASGKDNYKCPGSGSYVHASARVKAVAHAPCSEVRQEMLSRVAGQFDQWHDPHNNGTYTKSSADDELLSMSRRTGDGKYTDKMTFVLQPKGDSECTLLSCSESQVTSVVDFGTNYCNLRMMYCGSADGCKPVAHDFTSTEASVHTSSPAASHDMSLCFKV